MIVETIITDPVPVPQKPRKGAGRPAEPNPFLADVRVIAGKLNERTGRAMAVRETGMRDERDTPERHYGRVRRQLTKAGKVVAAERGRTDPYLIGMDIAADEHEGPGSFVLTFWDREIKA